MKYNVRQAFLPWRVIRFFGILLLLLVLFTIEFAGSIPIAAASLYVHFLLRLHWLESWLLTLVFSLAVAALYLVPWTLVFVVLMVAGVLVQRWSANLRGHSIRIVGVGAMLGIIPVIVFDPVITERIIGLSVISMAGAFLVVRQLQLHRK